MEAGTVAFSGCNSGKVKITITLNEGWSLQNVTEPVKIQSYNTAPSGNPNPGGFTTYKGNELEVTILCNNFYGIHLDLNKCN